MWKYFTYKNNQRYNGVLQDLVHSYNSTYHRSINMTPTEVNVEKEDYISKRLYGHKKQPPKWKYVLGDKVRIGKAKQTFKKGYLSSSWSDEIFIIVTRVPSDPITYELKDLNGVRIQGKFYEQELQQIS